MQIHWSCIKEVHGQLTALQSSRRRCYYRAAVVVGGRHAEPIFSHRAHIRQGNHRQAIYTVSVTCIHMSCQPRPHTCSLTRGGNCFSWAFLSLMFIWEWQSGIHVRVRVTIHRASGLSWKRPMHSGVSVSALFRCSGEPGWNIFSSFGFRFLQNRDNKPKNQKQTQK